MERTNFSSNTKEIQALREQIEEKLGFKMKTPRDFVFLSGAIMGVTSENLSSTTLKRVWGYIEESKKIRLNTLNVLSMFLGYGEWDSFLSFGGKKRIDILKTSDLNENDKIELCWRPNRRILVRYAGRNGFVVMEQENTMFSKDDTFNCSLFVLHEPTCINNFSCNSNSQDNFVFGGNGLTSICRVP